MEGTRVDVNVNKGKELPGVGPLPDGWYAAKVLRCEHALAKTGAHQCAIQLGLVHGKAVTGRSFFITYGTADGAIVAAGYRVVTELGEATDAVGESGKVLWPEMIDRYLAVKLETEPAQGDFRARNRIIAAAAWQKGQPLPR